MNTLSIESRLDFIRALDLPERVTLQLADGETKKNAAVDAGSLVAFVGDVSEQHQQDGLNCLLLAQLAANKKYDRESEVEKWYKYYCTVLENIGWVVGGFNFTEFSSLARSFSMDDVVIGLLKSLATDIDIALVTEMIDAFRALGEDDGAVKIYEENSHKYNKGNFQVGVANDDDGVMVLKLGAFHFQTEVNVKDILWFHFESAQTKFYQGAQTINLNDQLYAKVREEVEKKLGDRAVDFVSRIEI